MWILIANSLLLGIGLAMDAFSVSIANGLENPGMKKRKAILIASTFAIFQAVMPMIGWVCVHFIAEKFAIFNKIVPYIALILLSFIGGKMIFESVKTLRKKNKKSDENCTQTTSESTVLENTSDNIAETTSDTVVLEENNEVAIDTKHEEGKKLGIIALLVQGIATSIDALSVGFTISEYNYIQAILCALIIAVVTFVICIVGVFIGKKIGNKFTGKAEIIGGIILIAIGLEIFIKSFF